MNFRTSSGYMVFFFRALPAVFPTCGRMPLAALSLWPSRQPCRPSLVDDRRGGGPSSVAPLPTPVRSRLRARQQSQSSPDPVGKDSATSSAILTEAGTYVTVRLSF